MQKAPRSILFIFCLILILPSAGHWFDLDFFSSHDENRKLAERPNLSWSLQALRQFPVKYQAYYNDHFGFRNTLVRANYFLRFGLLGVSTSSQVVVGKKGWLYYTGGKTLDDYRGITRYDNEQLSEWARFLVLKRDWLKSQGIHYLLAIAPNKSTIYPECLPSGYSKVTEETGLGEFLSYIQQHTDLAVADLRQPLIEKRDEQPLFMRTDTHWNNYGAFLGYQELMKPLASWFPLIKPFKLGDFAITSKQRSGGDLAGMVGGQEFIQDEDYSFKPHKPFSARITERHNSPPITFTKTNVDTSLPRAVIFRDSFFTRMEPFVSENFSISRYIWTSWNNETPMEEIISQYRPHVVIEELVERSMKIRFDFFANGLPVYLRTFTEGLTASIEEGYVVEEKNFKVLKKAELKTTSEGLLINAVDWDSQLVFPIDDKNWDGNVGILLDITIESPHDTKMQIFYKTNEANNYSEINSTQTALKKGHNKVELMITNRDVTGQLRLDPGNTPGDYILKKMIIYPVYPSAPREAAALGTAKST